jgi:hypothetical protein
MIRMSFLTQMFGHLLDHKQLSDRVVIITFPVYLQPVRPTVEEFDGMSSKRED